VPALKKAIPAMKLPAATSHQKMPAAERQRLGITAGLLRLSVGIEDAGDVAADLLQALEG